jgi:hypothetical protein
MSLTPEQLASATETVRAMPWKAVVKLIKKTVEQFHRPEEMHQAVLDWFDLNRKQALDMAAVAPIMERLKQAAPYFEKMREGFESAPIGPYFIAVRHYLRDGKRYWLLQVRREDEAFVHSSNPDDMKRLRKIVNYAGGKFEDLLIDAGETAFWSWRA